MRKRKRRETSPEHVSGLLDGFLRRADRGAGLRGARVCASWREIAGPAVAAHSWAVRLTDGELVIAVDSAAWANELSLMRSRYVTMLQQRFGKEAVRSIRFTVSPTRHHARQDETRSAPQGSEAPPLAPDQEAAIAERVAAAVEDAELRDTIVRAILAVERTREAVDGSGRRRRMRD